MSKSLRLHDLKINSDLSCVSINKGKLFLGTLGNFFYILDAKTFEILHKIYNKNFATSHIHLTKQFVINYSDSVIRVFDSDTYQEKLNIEADSFQENQKMI